MRRQSTFTWPGLGRQELGLLIANHVTSDIRWWKSRFFSPKVGPMAPKKAKKISKGRTHTAFFPSPYSQRAYTTFHVALKFVRNMNSTSSPQNSCLTWSMCLLSQTLKHKTFSFFFFFFFFPNLELALFTIFFASLLGFIPNDGLIACWSFHPNPKINK